MKDEVACEGEDAAGGGGDEGLYEEGLFMVAEVEVDTRDLLGHLQRAWFAAACGLIGGHRGIWRLGDEL